MKNKKLLSLFLAVLMLVAIPFSVFAEGENAEETKSEGPAVVETVEEKEASEEETPQEPAKEVVEATEEVEEATEEPAEELEVGKPLMAPPLKEPAPGSITVTFELNGGTGTASANVISGQVVPKPADPVKEGSKFAGWYSDVGLTTEFDFTTKITTPTTIYAKWTDVVTVTFDSKGGSDVAAQEIEKGTKATKVIPTREGYTFEGWYTEEAYTNTFDFTKNVDANITLYAKWEANPVLPVVKALNISERSYSNGRFYGKVTDNDGVAVAGATVSLYNYNGSLVRTAVTTDANGYFDIYVGDYYYGYYDGYYYDDYYYDDFYYDGVRYYRDGNRWYYYDNGVKRWTDYRPYWNGKYYGKYYDGRYYGGYLLASKTDYTTSAKYYLNDGRYWDGYYYNRYYNGDYYNRYDHKVYPTDITRTNYSVKGYLKGYTNRTVYVYDDGVYLGSDVIDSNGYFSVTWNSPYVATGRSLDYYVDGKYVSDSGYSGAPIVNPVSAGSTFVRGTAGANATVTVYDASGIKLGSTTAGSTGIYNVTLNRALRAGEVITVEAKEAGRVARTTNYTVGGLAVSTEKVSQPAYISGFPDGTFKPGKEVTRAEAVRMFVKLVNNGEELPKNPTTSFKDANNAWYSDEINYAVAKGFIKGYSDGTFKPNQAITRAEFAQMISAFVKNGYPGTGSFKDVKGHWASDAISALYGNKNIKGYGDGTFKPDQKLTRAEAVTILNSVFGRNTKSNSFANVSEAGLKRFSDVSKSHWAYYEILDASNGHNAAKIEGMDQVSIWQ